MATYEYALQERTRSLQRLESLFQRLDRDLGDPQGLCELLRTYLELLDFCQRPELRLDLLMEGERMIQQLQAWAPLDGVDGAALQSWLERFQFQLHQIREQHQSFGETLRQSELLQLARGRYAVAGGLGTTDLPLLAFWQQQPAPLRAARLQQWRDSLAPLERLVGLILAFLRQSLQWTVAQAEHGRYAQALNARQAPSLVQIRLADGLVDVYPKVSGGVHRLHVQFLQWLDPGPSRALESTQSFQLGLSAC